MVRLFIKEEHLALQNRMIVKDDAGNDVFLIVGKWGRLGDMMTVYSMSGERLVEAKQTLLSVFPKFSLHKNGQYIGSIKKQGGLRGLRKPYVIVTKFNWLITGDYEKRRFTVRHIAKKIMTIEKTISYSGDFYILNIENEDHAAIACVLAVLLDHYVHKKNARWKEYKQEKYSLGLIHSVLLRFKPIKCEK